MCGRSLGLAVAVWATVLAAACSPAAPDPWLDRWAPGVEVALAPSADAPGRLEGVVLARGDAPLALELSGDGRATLRARTDAGEELTHELAAADGPLHALVLPGEGVRGVGLELELEGALEVVACRLEREVQPDPLPGGLAAGRSVLVFVEDSLTARHLSAYGNARDTSPHLERLAAGGARFTRATSQTSWTLSSVASLFTSMEQERHGLLRMDERLSAEPDTLAELFAKRGYHTVALIQNQVVAAQTGVDRGFARFVGFPPGPEGTARLIERAREELGNVDGPPVFLYVHLLPPHAPYTPPQEFAERYADPAYEGPIDGSIAACARIAQEKPPPGDPHLQQLVDLYHGHIRWGDATLGAVLEGAPDPLVVHTADHGEAFLEHGFQGHNETVHEEMVHVPLVVHAPGTPLVAGAVLDEPVSLLDVLPTLVDLCALPPPTHAVSGRSLVPLMLGERDVLPGAPRTLVLASRFKETESLHHGLRVGDLKLVRTPDATLLFDLDADPREERDLAAELPLTRAALASELERRYRLLRANGLKAQRVRIDREREQAIRELGY